MYSRQHYNDLSKTLSESKPQYYDARALTQWIKDTVAIARALYNGSNFDSNGNRTFDMIKFLKACDVELEWSQLTPLLT